MARLSRLIEMAFEEDRGGLVDLTCAAVIPAGLQGQALFVARSDGVVAGLPVAPLVFEEFRVEECVPAGRVSGNAGSQVDSVRAHCGSATMSRIPLQQVVERLEAHYGEPESTDVTDPWELIVWENIALTRPLARLMAEE